MNSSNAGETPALPVGQVQINYYFDLPPVHPRCRVFSVAAIMAYTEKLRSAGNVIAIAQLADALGVLGAQPEQGACHEFRSGRVGHAYIIPLRAMIGLSMDQLVKLGICNCNKCGLVRRGN